MRTPFPDQSEPQPSSRRQRRAGEPGAVQPRFGGGRTVVTPRQYAMRRR